MTGTELSAEQRTTWQSAQALWGVQLHDPELAPDAQAPSFAWFTFPPQVTFDLPLADRLGVGGFVESIFAHEIGHHTFSPSTRLAQLKISHQMARALVATDSTRIPRPEDQVQLLANLWSDMLINVRVAELQRRRDGAGVLPEMIRMWSVLSGNGSADRFWWVVMRAYEILWAQPAGLLCTVEPPPLTVEPAEAERRESARRDVAWRRELKIADAVAAGDTTLVATLQQENVDEVQLEFDELALADPRLDSILLAETVRTFGDDPISGALRFGMLMAPYLVRPSAASAHPGPVAAHAGLCSGESGADPATAGELVTVLGDARLQETPEHPAVVKGRRRADHMAGGEGRPGRSSPAGQGYGLAHTMTLYRDSDANAVIAAWYQNQARDFVRPLLARSETSGPTGTDLPGALETWDLGDDIADIDWAASMARGPTVVPGVTTRRREQLPDSPPSATVSLDLDLYIDSSGSMVNPANESPAALAGAILILSVLRGHGRVRVTSFSGAGQVAGGERFTRDRLVALRDLTTYFGGGTVFPLDLYRARYRGLERPDPTRRRHVVVLSDDGLLSMFGAGQPQFADVAARVRRGLDSATLILQDRRHSVATRAAETGYDVEYIDRMSDAPDAFVRLARRIANGPAGGLGRTRGGAHG